MKLTILGSGTCIPNKQMYGDVVMDMKPVNKEDHQDICLRRPNPKSFWIAEQAQHGSLKRLGLIIWRSTIFFFPPSSRPHRRLGSVFIRYKILSQ